MLLAVGAYVRLRVMETPAFARVQERKEVSTVPVLDLVREQPRTLLLGTGTRTVEGFTYNLFSVYLLAYVVGDPGLPRSWALTPVVVGAGLGAVLVLVSGRLGDRWGRKPVYRVGAWAAALFAFPAAWLVQTGERWALAVSRGGGSLWLVAATSLVCCRRPRRCGRGRRARLRESEADHGRIAVVETYRSPVRPYDRRATLTRGPTDHPLLRRSFFPP